MNDIEILEDFVKGKIQQDKLEHYRGGYKMGFFYTKDLQQAIENLLKERQADKDRIEKLEDCLQMAKQIMTYDISEDFDFMKLKEFKEYLLNEIKQNENYAD